MNRSPGRSFTIRPSGRGLLRQVQDRIREAVSPFGTAASGRTRVVARSETYSSANHTAHANETNGTA